MTRKLILALAILAIATGPAQARGGGHGSSGSHSHGHHHPVHLFGGFPFWGFPFGGVYTQFPYGYPCLWDEGQWVNQFYGDRYGNSTDVLEWVPGRWMCPDADDPAQWTHVAKGTRTILTSPSQTRDRTPSRPAGGSKRSTTLRGGGRGVRHDVPFPRRM